MSYGNLRIFLKSKEWKEKFSAFSTLLQTITVEHMDKRSPTLTHV
jgi:hypothetical protein